METGDNQSISYADMARFNKPVERKTIFSPEWDSFEQICTVLLSNGYWRTALNEARQYSAKIQPGLPQVKWLADRHGGATLSRFKTARLQNVEVLSGGATSNAFTVKPIKL